ncbi:galectin-9-like [Melanotaenia boesemani]|uniref:galectin-9-like n=1 Tax=Melanotaenia boesemani TaxID=1250792 RepID=UPI001C055CB7|nr:galectin-9-like [Melanotaenia boesemani]
MALVQQAPFVKPKIPFSGSIHGGLQEGKSITISGRVLPGADRFHVNLQYGIRPGADVALHFNPRYGWYPYVVTNTFQFGKWGPEERKQNFVLPAGSPFDLTITVTPDFYQFRINDYHFVDYRHRIPFQKVDSICIVGKVEISSVSFQTPAESEQRSTESERGEISTGKESEQRSTESERGEISTGKELISDSKPGWDQSMVTSAIHGAEVTISWSDCSLKLEDQASWGGLHSSCCKRRRLNCMFF